MAILKSQVYKYLLIMFKIFPRKCRDLKMIKNPFFPVMNV